MCTKHPETDLTDNFRLSEIAELVGLTQDQLIKLFEMFPRKTALSKITLQSQVENWNVRHEKVVLRIIFKHIHGSLTCNDYPLHLLRSKMIDIFGEIQNMQSKDYDLLNIGMGISIPMCYGPVYIPLT